MKLKLEITEKEKHFSYLILKAFFKRIIQSLLAIAMIWLISLTSLWFNELNLNHIVGVLFGTMFLIGKDWGKIRNQIFSKENFVCDSCNNKIKKDNKGVIWCNECHCINTM